MIKRDIEAKALYFSQKYPVVTITRPRQSGKTTLVKKNFSDYEYFTLENPLTRAQIQEDPSVLFYPKGKRIIIDEMQRLPELLSHIMKQPLLLILLIIASIGHLTAQTTITLIFTAHLNGNHHPLDSINISNITQGGDTMLYGTDTVLVLNHGIGIEDMIGFGNQIILYPVYPNPISQTSIIRLWLPQDGPVALKLYDLVGRELTTFERYPLLVSPKYRCYKCKWFFSFAGRESITRLYSHGGYGNFLDIFNKLLNWFLVYAIELKPY